MLPNTYSNPSAYQEEITAESLALLSDVEQKNPSQATKEKKDLPWRFLDEEREALAILIEEKDEDFTQLIRKGQQKYGKHAKAHRAKKKRSEASQKAAQTATQDYGRGHGGKSPSHPLLKTQRFDGMGLDSPIASEEARFENIAQLAEKHPELTLSPDLKLRIEMHNRLQLQQQLTSRPTMKMEPR